MKKWAVVLILLSSVLWAGEPDHGEEIERLNWEIANLHQQIAHMQERIDQLSRQSMTTLPGFQRELVEPKLLTRLSFISIPDDIEISGNKPILTLIFKTLVDEYGHPVDAHLVRSPGSDGYKLEQTGLDYVYSLEFEPSLYQDEPTEAWIHIGIHFKR